MNRIEKTKNTSLFFSEILGKNIFNPDDQKIGTLCDVLVDITKTYPDVVALKIQSGKSKKTIPLNAVELNSIWTKKLMLKAPLAKTQSYHAPQGGNILELKKSILDRQIVDLNGAKVARANDIHLLRSGNDLCLTDVDTGTRGLLRRLGCEEAVDKIVKVFRPSAPYFRGYRFVSWKYVHPVISKKKQDSLQLKIAKEQFNSINPADIADILEELDREQRQNIIDQMPDEMAAEILSETDAKTTQEILEVQPEERAADILEQMPPDKAADVLGDMEEDKAEEIISQMDKEEANIVTELLEHEDDSAGGLMTTEFVSFSPNTMVVTAIQNLISASEDVETIYDAFIVDKGKFVGAVSLKELLISPGHKTLAEVMTKKPVTISPEEKVKEVAEIFSKYNLITLPVVQKDSGEIAGIITVDDVVEELMKRW